MGSSYIPAEDGKCLTWLQTFANGIQQDPGLYMQSTADANAIRQAVDAFAAAYADAMDPAQRSPTRVADKDDARNEAVQLCRQVAVLIKYNAGISDSDKIAIGIRPVNPSRQPIHVGNTSPLLNVIGATPGAQTVRYADSMTPESGKKPFGATQLQLFVAVGEAVIDDPDAAQFYGAFTKNPIGVGFSSADDGKVATYFARWADRRGGTGPWSLPVSMRIAA